MCTGEHAGAPEDAKTGEYAAVVLFRRKLTAWRTGAGVVAPEVEFVG